jgi:hypothetical protein
MGLLCLNFPSLSLRRKKSKNSSSAPAARVVDEKAAIRSLASPSAAAIPFLQVTSAGLQPISSQEYLSSLDQPQSTERCVHISRRVRPDSPIIIGTTAEKREIAAAELIRDLKESKRRIIRHDEFRAKAVSGRKDWVWLAIDRDGEFFFFFLLYFVLFAGVNKADLEVDWNANPAQDSADQQ